MLRRLYTALLYVFAPLALAATAIRGLKDPLYRDRLMERLGYARLEFQSAPIWVHAVSVGEVQAAAVLVRALRKEYPDRPLLITTATPTGAQRVRALFGDTVRHAFMPYDLPGAVRRFLDTVRPAIAIVMEREIWPNLFRQCTQRGIPIVLASARLSALSAQRHRRFARLFGDALARNVLIAAQTDADAQRYRSIDTRIGDVHVTGNIKFDMQVPADLQAAGAKLRDEQFARRPVWIAGSTHAGEEDIVLDAHERIRARHPEALLLLVPRHPNRFDAVRAWLKDRNVAFASRSAADSVGPDASVLLVDTLGELLMFYAAADAAFVGGSLVPIGGHNLLEPAALGRPVVVGPHNFNAQDIAQLFLASGAAIEIRDAASLAEVVIDLLNEPQRGSAMAAQAASLLESNRGALERLMRLIAPLLSSSCA